MTDKSNRDTRWRLVRDVVVFQFKLGMEAVLDLTLIPASLAAAALDLDLSRSWLIGDHDRDIQMAINAGVPNTIRVLSHHAPSVPASYTVASTEQLPELLRRVL